MTTRGARPHRGGARRARRRIRAAGCGCSRRSRRCCAGDLRRLRLREPRGAPSAASAAPRSSGPAPPAASRPRPGSRSARCAARGRRGARAGDARPEGGRGEERKVVTALSPTSSASRHAPSSSTRRTSPPAARRTTRGSARELERFGGTVEKFIGDAVMAVFGAPVAHEDDPERAVRAALAIRDAMGDIADDRAATSCSVRIAVTTGEALVTLGARPSRGEGMVAGDVVNTASRLQAAAPVNGVLVGEATYRATQQAIELPRGRAGRARRGRPSRSASGRRRARARRSGVDVDRPRRRPLVGRDASSALLASALARARGARPQLVTLVGVPGIGKSRLVAELRRGSRPSRSWSAGARAAPALRRGRHALGARRDRQGRGRHPRDRLGRRAAAEAADGGRATLVRRARGGAGSRRTCARWSACGQRRRRGRPARRGVRRLAAVLRGARRARPAGPRLRGPALGRRRPARLRRPPRRLGRRRAAARRLPPPGRSCSSAGRAGAEASANAPTLSLAPLSRRRDRPPARRAARAGRAARRGAGGAAGSARAATRSSPRSTCACSTTAAAARDGGRSARAGVRAAAARDGPRHHRRPPRRAAGRGEGAAPGRGRDGQGLLGRRARRGRGPRRAERRGRLHALERKEFVRRERRSSVAGEDAVRVPPRAGPRRRLRADPARRPGRQAPPAAEWLESLAADRAEDHAELLAHHYGQALELAGAAGQATERWRGPAWPCATPATGHSRSAPTPPPPASTARRSTLAGRRPRAARISCCGSAAPATTSTAPAATCSARPARAADAGQARARGRGRGRALHTAWLGGNRVVADLHIEPRGHSSRRCPRRVRRRRCSPSTRAT